MKLEFEFNPHTALGMLMALEVICAPSNPPSDPEALLHLEQLLVLRDAFRSRATDIRAASLKRNAEWWVP
jgi:hypothetical protein